MHKTEFEKIIYESIVSIKGDIDFSPEKRLVTDFGFESIDVIDLFFEIQQSTNIDIDINEIAAIIGGTEGRRFNDITINDVVEYLSKKA